MVLRQIKTHEMVHDIFLVSY